MRLFAGGDRGPPRAEGRRVDLFPTINKVYARYFPTDPPARTFVTVGSWPMEFDVEIECVALA